MKAKTSMGGLIAINLGLRHNISRIVTINTPIYYLNIRRAFIDSIFVTLAGIFGKIVESLV